jgi:hypothetical protein
MELDGEECNGREMTIKKKIHHYVTEEEIVLQLSISTQGQVTRLNCMGSIWQSLLLSCSLISQSKPLQVQDIN